MLVAICAPTKGTPRTASYGARLPRSGLPISWAGVAFPWATPRNLLRARSRWFPERPINIRRSFVRRTVTLCCSCVPSCPCRLSLAARASVACCSAAPRDHQGDASWAGSMAPHPKGPIALIVEDDPIVRELAAALLEESDLRVVECEDAEQAIATLLQRRRRHRADFRRYSPARPARRRRSGAPRQSALAAHHHDRHPGYPGDRGRRRCRTTSSTCRSPGFALDVLMQAEQACDRARSGARSRNQDPSCWGTRG